MRCRNSNLGMVELWHKLDQRGISLPGKFIQGMCQLGLFPPAEDKTVYKPKPYEQMSYPDQRV